MEAWDDVIDGPPKDGDYMQHLTLFEKVCSNFIVFANYVKNTWLIPHKKKFVMEWINQVMHLGNTTI